MLAIFPVILIQSTLDHLHLHNAHLHLHVFNQFIINSYFVFQSQWKYLPKTLLIIRLAIRFNLHMKKFRWHLLRITLKLLILVSHQYYLRDHRLFLKELVFSYILIDFFIIFFVQFLTFFGLFIRINHFLVILIIFGENLLSLKDDDLLLIYDYFLNLILLISDSINLDVLSLYLIAYQFS